MIVGTRTKEDIGTGETRTGEDTGTGEILANGHAVGTGW